MSKQGRERTRQLHEAQRQAAVTQARRRRLVAVLGGGVVLALLVAIGFAVASAMGGDDDSGTVATDGPVVEPANFGSSGSFYVGKEKAPVTVTIYYDYMCPACGAFEKANGAELDRLVEDGTARVELRPISFLDRMSKGTQYSTRAANAFATVVDADPERAWAFHTALYEHQPQENTTGLDDDEIADIATEAGVPDEVADDFAKSTHSSWVAQVTRAAFKNGVEGTPTILIDGTVFDGDAYSTGPLTEAIETAASSQ